MQLLTVARAQRFRLAPRRLLPWLSLALLALPAAAAAGTPLEPAVVGQESYAETFTAIADLQDGTYLQIQLMISNVGWGDQHGICRMLVVPPRGKAWTRAHKVSHRHWRYQATPVPQLTVGSCTITGARAVIIDAGLDGGHLRLRLDAPLVSVLPPGHEVRVGSDSYCSDILVPRAPAEATLSLPGEEPRVLTGFGYADHSRSTTRPRDLGPLWVRFRGLGGSCSTLLLARLPGGAAPAEGWVWPASSQAPQALQAVRLRVPREPAPGNQVLVETAAGVYTLEPLARLFRYAPVEEHGMLGSIISSFVGNPVTITYRAVLSGGSCGPVPGILEVTHVDD